MDGGACGRSDGAGLSSSEVKPGGGDGGSERDELNRYGRRDAARGLLNAEDVADFCASLDRARHLCVPRPSIESIMEG